MITIGLHEIEDVQEFEFYVDGKRELTLSFNPKNFSIQISGGVDPKAIANTGASFFLRSKDRTK